MRNSSLLRSKIRRSSVLRKRRKFSIAENSLIFVGGDEE